MVIGQKTDLSGPYRPEELGSEQPHDGSSDESESDDDDSSQDSIAEDTEFPAPANAKIAKNEDDKELSHKPKIPDLTGMDKKAGASFGCGL